MVKVVRCRARHMRGYPSWSFSLRWVVDDDDVAGVPSVEVSLTGS